MRKILSFILACIILIIAILPWTIKGGSTESIVPNDLRQGPLYYEATVTAARVSTIEAGRSATSIIHVIPVRTEEIQAGITQPISTSIVRVYTVTTTTNSIKPLSPTSISTVIAEGVPPTPIGLIDIEDIITEEQLTEQLKNEPEGSQLRDLKVIFVDNGFQIQASLATFSSVGQKIEVYGEFLVKNYSLVVHVSSIFLNGSDVTLSYHEEIESRMDTSLYRLLPERYVQYYMLLEGKLIVSSKVRR